MSVIPSLHCAFGITNPIFIVQSASPIIKPDRTMTLPSPICGNRPRYITVLTYRHHFRLKLSFQSFLKLLVLLWGYARLFNPPVLQDM